MAGCNSAKRPGAETQLETPEEGNPSGPGGNQLNYLKFFVIAANRDIADIGLVRPLTVKDLDNLDQETFVKILTYLLTSSGVYTAEQISVSSL